MSVEIAEQDLVLGFNSGRAEDHSCTVVNYPCGSKPAFANLLLISSQNVHSQGSNFFKMFS